MICLQFMIPFARNKDAKALSSKFRYRSGCVSVIMRPTGGLISPYEAHGASWVWDPCSKGSYAILNIDFQTFSRLFSVLHFQNDLEYRHSSGYHDKSKIINVIWSIRKNHYQNACQKFKTGILLPFSILTGQKFFSTHFPVWKMTKLFKTP